MRWPKHILYEALDFKWTYASVSKKLFQYLKGGIYKHIFNHKTIVTFFGVNNFLQYVLPFQYKESLVQNFTQNALPYFESGKLKPIIDKIFPLEQIGNAHQLMEENKNTGKIVLKVREEAGKDEL